MTVNIVHIIISVLIAQTRRDSSDTKLDYWEYVTFFLTLDDPQTDFKKIKIKKYIFAFFGLSRASSELIECCLKIILDV